MNHLSKLNRFSLLLVIYLQSLSLLPQSPCDNELKTYQAGEKLTYKLYFNWTAIWITAGYADFNITESISQNRPAYKIACHGRTAKAFNSIYRVEDYYTTWIDKDNLQPLEFKRDVDEGGYTIQQHFTYNHESETVWIDYMKRRGNTEFSDIMKPFNMCTQDLLSAIYYARGLDTRYSKPGDKFILDVFIDGESYPVALTYLGKEEVKWNGKKHNCIKIKPELLSGDYFKEGDNIYIYATDDENHLPLIVESDLNFGKVKAYLHSYSGLLKPI